MAAKEPKPHTQGYALLEGCHYVVLPVELAQQVFALICQGEKVRYDWQTKTYSRDNEGMPILKMFSASDYATLHLNDD